MTVSKIDPVNNYTGNGSTTTFDFDFLIEDEAELLVQHTNANGVQATLTRNIDYTIAKVGSVTGSYITFPIEGSSYSILGYDEVLSLTTNLPAEQTREYKNSSKLSLETLEWSLDYLTRLIQQMVRQISRSVKVQEGSSQTADELVEVLQQAQINAANSAAAAADKAAEAANSAIAAGEEATIATQQTTTATQQATIATQQANIALEQAQDVLNIGEQIKTDLNTQLEEIITDITEETNKQIKNIQNVGFYMRDDKLYFINSEGEEEEFKSGSDFNTLEGCFSSGNTLNGNADILYAPGVGTQWVSWASPQLTSATSYGTITGDFSYTFYNGSSGSGATAGNGVTRTGYWEFPEKLKLSTFYYWAKSNPDRYGTSATINVYAVDGSTETLIGTGSYNGGGGGYNGSFSLDNSVEVTKIKVTYNGSWGGANGVWHLPFSLEGSRSIQVSTAETCYFNVGGEYSSLKGKLFDGTEFERSYIPEINISGLANGVYNIFVGEDTEEAIANNYIVSRATPSEPITNDVWVNTSIAPYTIKQYNGVEWLEYNKIPCGSFTISSGVITSVTQPVFNDNGIITPAMSIASFPDYTKGITVNLTTSTSASTTLLTAPSNGYVLGYISSKGAIGRLVLGVYEGSTKITEFANCHPSYDTGTSLTSTVYFHIQKGQIIKLEATIISGSGNIKFYPTKGVN